MLAAVLSQRVVLQGHKKKEGKHYDGIHRKNRNPKKRKKILPLHSKDITKPPYMAVDVLKAYSSV